MKFFGAAQGKPLESFKFSENADFKERRGYYS